MEQPGPESPAYLEALGRTIRVMRIDAKLERKELAERVGISYSYLSAIENGQRGPSPKLLFVLARALGVADHVVVAAARNRLENEAAASEPGEGGARPKVSMPAAPHEAMADARPAADNPVLYAAAAAPPPGPPAAASRARPAAGKSTRRSSVKRELTRLVDRMGEEDANTVLDIARRLADRPDR